jgi:uncharacterized protein YbjT (DUF2867 family)
MFAVTGITGKVGAAVARSLLSADQPVRAVVRDRSRSAPWAQLGCDIAVADSSDTEALTAAFAGTAGVFAMVPPVFDPAPGFPEAMGFINPLRAALARAKPARVVALSTVGADAPQPNLLNVLGRMEDVFGTLPMPVTFLRAAWFMENAAWDIDSAKSGLIQSYLQPLDRAVPMVSSDDVGRAAAAVLQERWEGKRVVELEGPQRVSPNALVRRRNGRHPGTLKTARFKSSGAGGSRDMDCGAAREYRQASGTFTMRATSPEWIFNILRARTIWSHELTQQLAIRQTE